MGLEQNVEGVGIGIDLFNGANTLETLRAIRTEMSAIASLSGRGSAGGNNLYGPSQQDLAQREANYRSEEKIEQDHINRMARIRAGAIRPIDNNEVNNLAQQKIRKANLDKQVSERVRQIEAETAQKNAQQEERLAQEAIQRRARINALQRQSSVTSEAGITNTAQQRALFQRYRNDPARDDLTNQYRRQIAEDTIAQREFLRGKKQLAQEYVDTTNRLREMRAKSARTIQTNVDRRRAIDLDEATFVPIPRQVRPIQSNERDARFYNDRIRRNSDTIASLKQYNETQLQLFELERTPFVGRNGKAPRGPGGPGGRGPGGGGPPREPNFNRPSGALNERGFFTTGDAVGRITRNILLYEVISRATYGLTNYISEAITAAKTTVEFANALRFATEQANGNLAENERLANSLQAVGLSRQQGRSTVIEAARFAQDKPEDIAPLARVAVNIAAARGLGIDKSDELIEQLRRRESKFYKRIFGTNVETIYEEAAAREVDKRTTSQISNPELYIGDDSKIKSRTQLIKEQLAAMDESKKEILIRNYVLSQAGRFEGEAAERANTLAGRLDKVNASFLNAKEGVGLFITELRPVNDLIDILAKKAGVLDLLRPPSVGRTGVNGAISESDIQQYGSDRAFGPRAAALDAINNNAYGVLGTAAVVGGAALFGRGKANESAKIAEYYKQLDIATTKYSGDLKAATQEATTLAQNTKAGLAKSTYAGLQRGTVGLTQSLAETLVGPQFSGGIGQGKGFGPRRYQALPGESLADYRRNSAEFRADYASPSRLQTGTGIAGGLLGGGLGATIGSIVAERMNVGPVVATGLTILGGIAGTAAGTFVGDAASRALTSSGATAVLSSSIGIAGAILASAGVVAGVAAYTSTSEYRAFSDKALKAIEQTEVARNQQRKEETRARSEGRLVYRDSATGRTISPEEYAARTDKDIRFADRNRATTAPSIGPGGALASLLNAILPGSSGAASATSRTFLDTKYKQEILPIAPIDRSSVTGLNTSLSLLQGRAGGLTGEALREEIELRTKKLNLLRATEDDERRNQAEIIVETKSIQNLNDNLAQQLKVRELINLQKEYGTTDKDYINNTLIPYRAEAAQREKDRKEKEQKEKDESIAARSAALSKLRDFKEGSFRGVDITANLIAGPDNDFTKVLADQITLAERMRQQWGFLGQDIVDYQIKLERAAAARTITKLEFGSYQRSSGLLGQINSELAQRNGPGLSRADQDYLNVQSAIVDKAVQMPLLWKQAAESFGRQIDPVTLALKQVANLSLALGTGAVESRAFPTLGGGLVGGGRIAGFSSGSRAATVVGPDGRTIETTIDAGRSNDYSKYYQAQLEFASQSPEVKRRTKESFADAAIDALKDLSPRQLAVSGLGSVYRGALGIRAGGLQTRIEEEQKKALFNAQEDERLNKQLRADEEFRSREIAKGRPADEVGAQSDKLLLARTENINPKDLTYSQFSDRSQALRREVEREVKKQEDAQKAVEAGLKFQQDTLTTVEEIRNAIIGGNLALAININNRTEAEVDERALRPATEIPGSSKYTSFNGDIKLGSNSLKKYQRFGKRD